MVPRQAGEIIGLPLPGSGGGMMEEVAPAHSTQPFDSASRHLQHQFAGFAHTPAHQESNTFASQLDPSLQALDSGDAFTQHFNQQLEDPNHGQQQLHLGNGFIHRNPPPRFQEIRTHAGPPRHQQNNTVQPVGQFGILTPQAQLSHHNYLQHDALERIGQENDLMQMTPSASGQGKKDGHFADLKMIPDPPDLQSWRERLFHVDDTITLSEDE